MRIARPASLVALAIPVFAAACGLDFDRFGPLGDASTADGSGGLDAARPDGGAGGDSTTTPPDSASGSEAAPEASPGNDATGGTDAPAEVSTKDGGPCGQPGEPCCAGANACTGGGCCNAGTCAARGASPTIGSVCLDGTLVACGGGGGPNNQPCCQSSQCSNRCCVDGLCIRQGSTCGGTPSLGTCGGGSSCGTCGGDGQPCCTGAPGGVGEAANFCTTSGEACDPATGKCATCGGNNHPCCDGVWCGGNGCCDQTAKKCVPNTATCGGGQGTCTNGACQGGACGGMGEPCCGGNVGCTAPFSACQAGVCVGCGGTGEPCCPGNNTGGFWCSSGDTCDKASGNCLACGGTGQPCCAGAGCRIGACAAGKCP